MEIDLQDNNIIASDINNSKLYLQLSFWDFIEDNNLYLYKGDATSTAIILNKLIKYLNNNKIIYSLTPSCENYLLLHQKQSELLNHRKELCSQFKAGQLNARQIHKINSFLCNQIPRKLKEHQIKAGIHLYLSKNGANFSVPGAGKTSVVISIYEKLKHEKKVNKLFVIGPTACFIPWIDEYNLTFNTNIDSIILAGGDPKNRKSQYYKISTTEGPELILTSFQSLVNDRNEIQLFLKHKNNDVFLVIDEAHYIKQLDGIWANVVLEIAPFAVRRCILTGTPLPRGYSDLFNQFDFLWPTNNLFDDTIRTKISLLEDNSEYSSIKTIVDENIGPLFYRVRKSELRLASQIHHDPIIIKMKEKEELLYNVINKKIRYLSKEDYIKSAPILNRLMRCRIIRLRQSVSYPRLLISAIEGYTEQFFSEESKIFNIIKSYDDLETPAKIDYLINKVAEYNSVNQKVIIWVHFIGTIKLIEKHLKNNNINCETYYGNTPIEVTPFSQERSREEIRKLFNDPKSGLDVLIANPSACGESISLHKHCSHAIYYDLSYNLAQYLQSLDRIHRVGGSEERESHYYYLQYENTIERDIMLNLETKRKRMYEIIEKDYEIYSLDMFEDDESDIKAYRRLISSTDD